MPYPRVNPQTATATATNAAATATIAAPSIPDSRWQISRVLATVSGGSALVLVKSGTNVVWQGHVSSTAPMSEAFDPPLMADPSKPVSVTVGDAGASNTGSANIQAFLM